MYQMELSEDDALLKVRQGRGEGRPGSIWSRKHRTRTRWVLHATTIQPVSIKKQSKYTPEYKKLMNKKHTNKKNEQMTKKHYNRHTNCEDRSNQ